MRTVMKAILGTDLMHVEAVEHRALDGDADQTRIFTVTSSRISGAHVPIHVDDRYSCATCAFGRAVSRRSSLDTT